MILLIAAVVVIVVFFVLFPRPTLIALTGIIILGAAVGAFIYLQQSDRNSLASQVTGSTRGTTDCAEPDKPVFVEFSNGSSKQVNVIRFRLVGKRPGFSVETYSDYLTSYKIIAPHDAYGACWALNRYRGLQSSPDKTAPADLQWSVDISSVDFEGD